MLQVQLEWQQDWKKAPRVGRFDISNRIKPSLSPTHHFRTSKPTASLWPLSTTMSHRTLLHRRIPANIPPTLTRPINMPLRRQSTGNQKPHHHRMSQVQPPPILLGTKEGITALSEFIIKSGAFSRTGNTPTNPSPPTLENQPIPNMDQEFVEDDGG